MARAARDAEDQFQPRALYRQLAAVDAGSDRLTFEDGITLQSAAFGRYVAGATAFILFVVTMGEALDERVSAAIAEEDVLHALLLETAGWLAVESATRSLVMHLKAEAVPADHRLSLRMGPGYSYKIEGQAVSWPLEQQAELFRLLRPEALGMTLLESCAMLPKISRSGIYGIVPDLNS
jgi:cobalamin-dependent methionine synthase I